MTTVTISLPDSLKEFIDNEVQTKGYGNVSEYVRGLLREARAREANMRIEALLVDGLSRGTEIPLSSVFWSELRSDAAKILARHRQSAKKRPKR
ncbi:MAG TPA: type II toxin-antitoxin system ParD family antitoxin [Terracidiphilus sp.]|nr:type II toxin-antitoxin system ParD family antitoxin [Terracidiphilus sp.]